MSPAPISRRTVVAAAGAALGAAALPAGITAAVAAETAPTGLPGAVTPAFDPGAYVADLEAIGCRLAVWQPVRKRGGWSYSIGSPEGRGFGRPYLEVMQRWDSAIEACEDHGERVAAFLIERGGAAA